jgi:hypothetical protein
VLGTAWAAPQLVEKKASLKQKKAG